MSDFGQQPTVRIESVAFGEGRVEVSFVQAHNEGASWVKGESLVMAMDSIPEDVLVEAHEALLALLEAMELVVRNPPERKSPFARGER